MANHVITELDYNRLLRLLHGFIQRHPEEQHRLSDVYEGLKQANIVKAEMVPRDIVTMHSIVSIVNPETGQKRHIELAYPGEANPAADRVSVLTPLGTALLGNRIGGIVDDQEPDRRQKWLIESIHFQPEAAGQYDL